MWYYDGSLETPAPNKFHLTGIGWLRILSPDLTRACVDAEVSSPGTDRARLTLRGDTLYVLDQVIAAPALGSIRSVIRRYHLSSEGCDWLPLKRR